MKSLWKCEWWFLKKLKIELQCDPLIHFWVFEENKSKFKKICVPHVHCSIIFNSPGMKKNWVFKDGWMNKEIGLFINTHTHTGILFRHKKEWNLTLCENMKGLQWYYAKWNKLEKDKCQIIPLYVKFKQEEIKVMDTENRLVAVKRWEGWEKWLKRVKRYKLLLIK